MQLSSLTVSKRIVAHRVDELVHKVMS